MNEQPKEKSILLSTSISIHDLLCGSLQEASDAVLGIRKKLQELHSVSYIDQFHRIELNVFQSYDELELQVYGIRYETPEEVSKRVRIEQQRKERAEKNRAAKLAARLAREDKERELYLKLKEKYGDIQNY